MSRSLFLTVARLVVLVPPLLLVDVRPVLCGGVSFLGAQIDDTSGVDGLDGAMFVAVSPDGQNVYVTSDGDDALAVFGRSFPPGSLTFVEKKTGIYLNGARSIVVSPDGKHVYTAGDSGMAVAVFSRNAMAGGP